MLEMLERFKNIIKTSFKRPTAYQNYVKDLPTRDYIIFNISHNICWEVSCQKSWKYRRILTHLKKTVHKMHVFFTFTLLNCFILHVYSGDRLPRALDDIDYDLLTTEL